VSKPKKIGTKTGTNIFKTLGDAVRYYRPYGYKLDDVREKITSEAIIVNAHPKGEGEWDRHNRWWEIKMIQVHSNRKKK
jgi:hypothetical protein